MVCVTTGAARCWPARSSALPGTRGEGSGSPGNNGTANVGRTLPPSGLGSFSEERVPSGPAQGGPCGSPRWGRGPLLSVGGPFWDRRRLAPARWVPARSRAGSGGVLRTLWAVGAFPVPRGARPGGPACQQGPHFSREMGRRRGGQAPWTPGFRARSFPLARFGVVGRIVPVEGLVRCPCTYPDLERFFRVGADNPEASPWGSCHRR